MIFSMVFVFFFSNPSRNFVSIAWPFLRSALEHRVSFESGALRAISLYTLLSLPLALFRSVLLSRSQSVIVYLFVLSTFGRHKRVFEVVYGYARFSIESFRWFNRKSLSPSCSLPPALSIENAVRATWQLVWLFSHIFHAKPCQEESNPELKSESASELET